jgi:hypothetical protein
MNPHIDNKPPLTEEEFDELKKLVSNGQQNFSKEVLSSAEYLHPLNLKLSYTPVCHIATAEYLFRCSFCTDINFPIHWYKIILDTVGGDASYQPRSRVSDLEKGYNGENLAKINEGDKTDYQDSSINFKKSIGYICDHCRDCMSDN